MSRFWNQRLRGMKPYVAGEQPKDKAFIKLNTNENPYPPSPNAVAAMQKMAFQDLRLYPDPECTGLRSALAKFHSLREEQIFVGNGSDEILAFCYLAYFEKDKEILFPEITFSFYKVWAQMFGIPYETIPLKEDFTLQVEAFATPNGGILLANPNAPTGLSLEPEDIEAIVKKHTQSVVIIDEAYVDFGGKSVISLIKHYPNLLVVRTMSKSRSLAGLRVGYALGSEELIEGLRGVKNSFNSYTMDRVALAGATAAVNDDAYFEDSVRKVVATRERCKLALREMGFYVTDSKANFLFLSHPALNIEELVLFLREKGILVRHSPQKGIENFMRVSIGMEEEMNQFLEITERFCDIMGVSMGD